ncbi:hypothetical protein HC022_02175 [Salipiger sp. HF18]|uniref:right-handed parallel beta-helix repeat-containing protein n=1 Tax=Salipiger sp. HF18 TaxID=2721557 RepID=UPI00142E90DC|nr:right-handed parallel beta-helix repeat-containing protein [Salipiger sp. HF18]NIY95098.1 hypothetical protein [Salipiger sp. HF18]
MTSSQTSAAERARRTAGWRPKPGLRSAMIALFATMMVADTAHADDRQDLIAALKGAKGGEVISLPDGDYGDLTIDRAFPATVSLRASSPGGAVFGTFTVSGGNLIIDGVTVTERLVIKDADKVRIVNSRLKAWSEALFSSNIELQGNDIPATLNFDTVDTFDISGNVIGRVPGGINDDLIRIIGASSQGTIQNNSLEDAAPQRYPDGTYTHADGIQFINRGADWPHDIVIRGNLIYDDPSTGDRELWMQPLAIGGNNILIEENLVMGGTPNTIIVANTSGGVKVLNNTVLPWPKGGGGTIRVNSTTSGVVVDGNVTAGIINQGNATVGDNYVYSTRASAPNHFAKLFAGNGRAWQDYVPAAGSPVALGTRYGAQKRLRELLGR